MSSEPRKSKNNGINKSFKLSLLKSNPDFYAHWAKRGDFIAGQIRSKTAFARGITDEHTQQDASIHHT